MSTKTANLKMTLPADGDSADIQVINTDPQTLDTWVGHSRESANDIYPGRNIASIPEIADEVNGYSAPWLFLAARVAAGDYSGLQVRDYFNVQRTNGTTERIDILGFDHYCNCSDKPMARHIVCGAHAPVAVTESAYAVNGGYIKWNTTETNQGTAAQPSPYLNSNLHKWELEAFLPSLPATLQGKIINHRSLAESRYSADGVLTASTGWAWADLGKVWSPSEMEVYGCSAWGTPGYSQGMDSQFPAFKSTKDRILGGRVDWWLRVVSGSSASHVCDVIYLGTASDSSASNTWVRPLPCFLLGA